MQNFWLCIMLAATLNAGTLIFSITSFQWLFQGSWSDRLIAGIVDSTAAGRIKNLTKGFIG